MPKVFISIARNERSDRIQMLANDNTSGRLFGSHKEPNRDAKSLTSRCNT